MTNQDEMAAFSNDHKNWSRSGFNWCIEKCFGNI